MKPIPLILSLFICLSFINCETSRHAIPPSYSGGDKYQGHLGGTEALTITESLFKDKDSTLSEEAIQTLLNGKIVFPDTLRIAVFNYAPQKSNYYNHFYRWDNEEYLGLQQAYMETVVSGLKASKRVKKVILMPSILANSTSSLTQLREATVRLQADLLLIFHLQSDLYYKYRLFKKDEAKAYANCEALLMDIRTGMIPHADVLTNEQLIQKKDQDFDVETMQKRAVKASVLGVLEEITQSIAAFIEELGSE